jgi:hypothetical protein
MAHKSRWQAGITLLFVALVALPTHLTLAQGGDSGRCGDPTIETLWAGQTIDSGTVAVWNDEDNLYVQFRTTGGWTLTETHVHVATSLADIPTNDQGVPVPGQFDYSATHANITTYTYVIPLTWPEGSDLVIAAHASVALMDAGGEAIQTETAWGGDHPGGGARWWFYLTHTVQTCDDGEPSPEAGGCTPGYWRNHTDDWGPTGYAPAQTVGSVFGSAPDELAGDSLLDAVKYQSRGSDRTLGAARTLLRAGVAALLNAAHPDIDYPRTSSSVIATINVALGSGDRAMMLALAEMLDDDNNLGCSLSGPNTTSPGSGKPKNPGSQGQGQGQGQSQGQGHGQGQGGGKPDDPGSQGRGKGRDKEK